MENASLKDCLCNQFYLSLFSKTPLLASCRLLVKRRWLIEGREHLSLGLPGSEARADLVVRSVARLHNQTYILGTLRRQLDTAEYFAAVLVFKRVDETTLVLASNAEVLSLRLMMRDDKECRVKVAS